MKNVIVFGSLNMDMTIESDRVPQAGETISGRGFFLNPGGKGANQAVAAARLGAPVHMVGAVGRDLFGGQMLAALKGVGVSCGAVAQVGECPTGVASITRIAGDNRIILDAGANRALTAVDVARALDELAQSGDVFLTQLECDVPATLEALAEAHRRDMYTVLNPAPACALPEQIWQSVNLVCLNETECEAIAGVYPESEAEIEHAAEWFIERGVRVVAITLGGRGSAVLTPTGRLTSVPPAHEVVDTTCAGDTYIGALVACYAAGLSLEEAVEWASCASALTTTKLGAQQAIPAREEVAQLVASRA